MVNDREQPRVVLIFGDPGQGKSPLANRLRKHRYHVIGLDAVYLEFVKAQYPTWDFQTLNEVIAQHYFILRRVNGVEEAWRDYVASRVEKDSSQNALVAVEGYLLLPTLDAVQKRLAGKAAVTLVEVRGGQYFTPTTTSIEQILA